MFVTLDTFQFPMVAEIEAAVEHIAHIRHIDMSQFPMGILKELF